MSFDIEFGEVTHLHADLAAAPARVDRGAQDAVGDYVSGTERDARAFAPVLTGELKAGIRGRAVGLLGEVISEAPYSGYVEEGTSDTAPQPFLGPAHEANVPGVERRLGDAGEGIL